MDKNKKTALCSEHGFLPERRQTAVRGERSSKWCLLRFSVAIDDCRWCMVGVVMTGEHDGGC
jgi:hypothetical protein